MKPTIGRICLLALGPALGLGIARFAYGLLLPAMKSDLGWSYSQAGWINTVNAIGYIAGASSAAAAARRLGAARTYGLGALVTIVSLFALGLTDNFVTLSLFRFLSGISGAWIFVTGGAMTISLAAGQPRDRSIAIGIFYAGAGFGLSATGLLVPGWLEMFGQQSWRSIWLLLAAMGAVFALAGYYSARTAAPTHASSNGTRSGYSSFDHKWVLLGYAAFGAGSTGYMTFMVAYLKSSGQPAWHLSAFWTAIGLAAMAAPWIWSRLLSTAQNAVAFSTLVGMNTFGAALALAFPSFSGSISSAVVFGSTFFAVVAATSEYVRCNVNPTQKTDAIGAFTLAFGLGQTLGPFAIGLITDTTGSLVQGLLTGILVAAAGAVLSLMQRPS
ncbi:YbfB/YjiJ family MFS transporter (plasmid) [Rhizobium bangladeshense]|uniref:YbfB/YjiJ family MFS transporter n=1 Tax=Rhizobium bangladeshense TaxID=1138189 RepID=UPI001A97F807|nr:YbfB/YjiJ family MFS transporter [Rhizobium bangladeshense]QSY97811.1 YbfB/YjiJ family MFS transporter [Rhizobium bangladeshense]